MIVEVQRAGRFWLRQTIEIPDDTPSHLIESVAAELSDELGWGWDEAEHETENITVKQ